MRPGGGPPGRFFSTFSRTGFAAGEIDDAGRTSEFRGHIVKSSELPRFAALKKVFTTEIDQ